MGFLQRPSRAFASSHAGLVSTCSSSGLCLPAGPAGGSGVLDASHALVVSVSNRRERGVHWPTRSCFRPRERLSLEPPNTILLSRYCWDLYHTQEHLFKWKEGRFPPDHLKVMGVHRHVSYEPRAASARAWLPADAPPSSTTPTGGTRVRAFGCNAAVYWLHILATAAV